jgi:hypothetical protein
MVLAQLGLDANLLDAGTGGPAQGLGPKYFGQMRKIIADANLDPEVAKRLGAVMDQMSAEEARAANEHGAHGNSKSPLDSNPEAERDRRREQGERDSRQYADDEGEEELRSYLMEKGLGGDDCEEAMNLARGDRGRAGDALPEPGTRGGMGGKFSQKPATAMDEITTALRFAGRIGLDSTSVPHGTTRGRDERARPRVPTAAERASLEEMFPEAARISTTW